LVLSFRAILKRFKIKKCLLVIGIRLFYFRVKWIILLYIEKQYYQNNHIQYAKENFVMVKKLPCLQFLVQKFYGQETI